MATRNETGTDIGIDVEALTKDLERADEIGERVRIAGYGLAAPLLRTRQRQAARELARVVARKGADHPEVAARQATLERVVAKQALFDAELSRARVDRPTLQTDTGAGISGRVVRGGGPVVDVTLLALAQGKRVAYDCTDANGGFALEVPSGTPLALSVRSKDGVEHYRDPREDSLLEGELRFREIDLSVAEPPCEPPPDGEPPAPDPRFAMVDLVGRAQADALAILRTQGLVPGAIRFEPTPDRAGLVIAHEPPAGALVKAGDSVDLVVGLSDKATVPDVVGLPLDDAKATLEKAGLRIGAVQEVALQGAKPGFVFAQSPSAGSSVDRGASIDLRIGKAVEPRLRSEIPAVPAAPTPDVTRVATLAEERLRRRKGAGIDESWGFLEGKLTDAGVSDLPALDALLERERRDVCDRLGARNLTEAGRWITALLRARKDISG